MVKPVVLALLAVLCGCATIKRSVDVPVGEATKEPFAGKHYYTVLDALGPPAQISTLPEGFVFNGTHSYEFHPDGRRFIVGRFVKTAPPPPTTRLELLHNWFAELERLCPTRR